MKSPAVASHPAPDALELTKPLVYIKSSSSSVSVYDCQLKYSAGGVCSLNEAGILFKIFSHTSQRPGWDIPFPSQILLITLFFLRRSHASAAVSFRCILAGGRPTMTSSSLVGVDLRAPVVSAPCKDLVQGLLHERPHDFDDVSFGHIGARRLCISDHLDRTVFPKLREQSVHDDVPHQR